MGEPLASAVIITYNQEKYIEQTIECALAQKVDFDYEIIIGEDCSTDRTREICLRYQEKYPDIIRVITSDKNVGLLDNWYRSVKAARGKYIAGCGGDDYWHNPDKIRKQVEFLEDNPEYGMVHSDADVYYEDKNLLIKNYYKKSKITFPENGGYILDLLFLGKYQVFACSAVFKKYFFNKHYDISELKKYRIIMEDVPLWFIIAANEKIYYMPDSFLVRREMKGTISNPHSFNKMIQLWESCHACYKLSFEKFNSKIQDKSITIKTINKALNSKLQRIAIRENQKILVQQYYFNIINQAGYSYLSLTDKIRYYSTKVPLGTKLYNILQSHWLKFKKVLPFLNSYLEKCLR